MRLLIDAQLPVRLARYLEDAGHDVRHTSELPEGNATSDARIAELADMEGRFVFTKDRDFRDGHLLRGVPQRLFVVATGNITNAELLSLFETNLEEIATALEASDFIELRSTALIVY